LLALLLFLGVLWWGYTQLPGPIRHGIGRTHQRKRDGHQGHH
jgi:hypothetical protein